jgi:hypothetical protein
MNFEILPLAMRKAAHVDDLLRLDAHALERGAMGNAGNNQIT